MWDDAARLDAALVPPDRRRAPTARARSSATGVVAALVPGVRASARSSTPVVYEHPDALAAAYDEIAAAYDEIGAKWTVWVHDGDRDTAALLERAGHVLDAAPGGDGRRPRRGTRRGARPTTRWRTGPPRATLADVGAINDRAYGHGGDWFSRALTGLPERRGPPLRRAPGRRAGRLLRDRRQRREHRGPDGRGASPRRAAAGISGKLIAHALADAVERGMHDQHAGGHQARPPGLRAARLPRR